MCRKLFLFVLLLCMTGQVNAVSPGVKNSIALAWGIIQQHPFITAVVVVILLQEEPWEFIKETLKYFVEEHPLLTVIVLGLILSGAYKEIIGCAHGVWAVLYYAVRFGLGAK